MRHKSDSEDVSYGVARQQTDNRGLRIREMPHAERPRERLCKRGAAALKTSELMAILFRTGTRDASAEAVAERLLASFGDLRSVARASIEELCECDGIGMVKAIELRAAFELGKRLMESTREPRPVIRCPADVADLVMNDLKLLDQEHFLVLLLDTKNRVVRIEHVFKGSLNASVSHPREAFRAAVTNAAAAVILVHNHPSGDPRPSQDDIATTRRMTEAGETLGIPLLDHIIVGDGKHVSLKEQGVI
ncbi:MAG: DNA repair protein RadC [Candidatus Hydrogenedentes bacterium]|nr:DNA repair protein RadC [Candidatus Hydrogenedentota bacterium]